VSGEGGGTRSRTYARTESRTVSYVITQSAAVAWYIREDLARFVAQKKIDLSEALAVPHRERTYTDPQLVELLCDDIAHMLREGLVRRVHLLLYHDELDAGTGAFPLLYKATYEISEQPGLSTKGLKRQGGLLQPPDFAAGELAMLIDWNPDADRMSRRRVRYPSYNLNWVTPDRRFDPTTLVKYRKGSLTGVGVTIVWRDEEATSASLRYLDPA
jgi:hypothetical protein